MEGRNAILKTKHYIHSVGAECHLHCIHLMKQMMLDVLQEVLAQ